MNVFIPLSDDPDDWPESLEELVPYQAGCPLLSRLQRGAAAPVSPGEARERRPRRRPVPPPCPH
jgi:hypothetical protein